jgi:hypothetical protein
MRAEPFADIIVPPTHERWMRGDVERSPRQINDSKGDIGDPFVTVGLLLKMHRAARITDDKLAAGYRFRGDFAAAHLDRLGVRDLSKPRIDGGRRQGELTLRTIAARERVMSAIAALGGIDSPAGSCCWHVVGEDMTLKTWATTRFLSRRITENAAPGVLLAALGCLAAYYQRGRR